MVNGYSPAASIADVLFKITSSVFGQHGTKQRNPFTHLEFIKSEFERTHSVTKTSELFHTPQRSSAVRTPVSHASTASQGLSSIAPTAHPNEEYGGTQCLPSQASPGFIPSPTSGLAYLRRPMQWQECSAATTPGRAPAQLYLIIHNIDGEGLRSHQSQTILSTLAAIPQIHIVASIDHVNAPLLWDSQMIINYNWSWQHVVTFARYHLETSFLALPLDTTAKRRGPRGHMSVLLNVTTNAQKVFCILAEQQLKSKEQRGRGCETLRSFC